MANFINTVDVVGDELLTDSLISRSVTEYKDDTVQTIGTRAFAECKSLVIVDTPALNEILMYAFNNCSNLTALILRNVSKVARLDDASSFNGSPIKTGTGYIYVPSALVDSYKSSVTWSTHAARFRVLEDYTVDGTTTGALDESKI